MLQYKEQVQSLDCGIAVIQMIHNYFYDQWISLASLKSNVNYSTEGINILELSALGAKFGIHLESYEGQIDALNNLELKQPIISIIKSDTFLHYIVIDKIKNGYVIYYDPISGRKKISFDDFSKIYNNIIIIATKTSYQHSKEAKIIKLFQFDYLKEAIWLTIVSIMIVGLSFIGTFYLKIVLDQIVPSQLKNQFLIMSLFFILILIIKLLLSFTKNWFLNRIQIKYNLNYLNRYVNKIETIKWLKINQYNESMHLKNIEFLMHISRFKANYLFNTITEGFCLILATTILLWLDPTIFFITLLSSSLIIGITVLFQKQFKNLEKTNIANAIKFQKSFFNIISGIEQFKISPVKILLENNFQQNLDQSIDVGIKNYNYHAIYNLLINVIEGIFPFVIATLSIFRIWENNLTVGQLILFMSMYSYFTGPMHVFTNMIIEIPINLQYLDNLNAFLILDDETKNEGGQTIDKIKEIKIEKLNFSFVEGKNILKIANLKIDQKLHLSGKNGCGKSTLLKILSTLITVDKVSYNGKLIDYYNLDLLRSQICYLANYEYIPSLTIYQYLTNNLQEQSKILLENIEKYHLLDLFEQMNLQLSDQLDENANNLSAGQKQFISLMKLFANNYSLVLLDEALENLDLNILEKIKPLLQEHLHDALVLEISHRQNYLFEAKELNCEQFK